MNEMSVRSHDAWTGRMCRYRKLNVKSVAKANVNIDQSYECHRGKVFLQASFVFKVEWKLNI